MDAQVLKTVGGTTYYQLDDDGNLTLAGALTAAGLTVSTGYVVSLAAGTAAAPSLTFTGDTDSGLYRSSANTIGFAVGGASVGTWASTGLALVTPLTTTRGVSSGTALTVGGRATTSTASSTTIAGGSGAQSYDVTCVLPAGMLLSSTRLRILGQVRALAQNSTDTFTITVRVGGTTIATSTATNIAPDDRCVFDLWLSARAAPGAAVACAFGGYTAWSTTGTGPTMSGGIANLATNGELTVDVQVTYGSSNAGNTSALELLIVEVV